MSLVKQACDSSGDNKGMGHWTDFFGPDSVGLFIGLSEQRPRPVFDGGRPVPLGPSSPFKLFKKHHKSSLNQRNLLNPMSLTSD